MFPAATSIKRFVSMTLGGKRALVLAAAAALSVPVLAHADYRYDRGRDDRSSNWHDSDRHDDRRDDRHDDHHDYDRGHGGTNIDLNIRLGGGGPRPPEYCQREVQVWVPATYRTVVDRKWVEPVYRTECERVWVPPVFEDREVHFIGERGRPRVRIDRVLVREGYFENRERRVCVSEGHWENCERQELVCAGHYETHIERVRVPYRVDPLAVVNPGLSGIWHR